MAWFGVAWRGVVWRGVALLGMAWRGVAWRGVAWFGLAWFDFFICSEIADHPINNKSSFLTNYIFSSTLHIDIQVRKVFYQNESDFHLQEANGENFLRIPSANLDNGLNTLSYF